MGARQELPTFRRGLGRGGVGSAREPICSRASRAGLVRQREGCSAFRT